jgi:hypothetical protein
MLANMSRVRAHRSTHLVILTDVFFLDIANYIYENPSQLDLDLQGIWISDRRLLPLFPPSPY